MSDRYVLLGLALPRSQWFRRVGQWATSAAIPAEFVKCVSAGEVGHHLDGARPLSAALLDGGAPSVDRTLLATLRDHGCPPLVVDDGDAASWAELGAAAVLPTSFDREQLLDALAEHAALLRQPLEAERAGDDERGVAEQAGLLVAVLGSGGTGASTVAVLIAQGLRHDPGGTFGSVLLADLCRHAQQAMLHDARDVFPGVQELLELHRGRPPSFEQVRDQTFRVEERRYDLLLGLRRHTHWPTVRQALLEPALTSLRLGWSAVVCDCDSDLDGEAETGSPDVEDRHALTRTATARADVVVAVGVPGLKGLHSLVGLIDELLGHGVPPGRIAPLINHAPRKPRARAELARVLTDLVSTTVGDAALAPTAFLPHRSIEEALHDGTMLPGSLARTAAGTVKAVAEQAPPLPTPPVGSGTHGRHDVDGAVAREVAAP